MIKKLLILIGLVFVLSPLTALARDASQITDWYIKDFQSEIIVNKDSSLDITEKITADCGNLPNKHGIFRVLPIQYKLDNGQTIKTPVQLGSITDFNGNPYQYKTTNSNSTVTWKIGDPDVTVQGVNYYKITYQVKNVIRFGNTNFDEFYWNLNGNFWEIETDLFLANITFPTAIKNQSEVNLYSGSFGTKNAGLATYSWMSDKTLRVESNRTLRVGEGITLSATTPKDIFTPYVPGFWEANGQYFFLLFPIIFFLLSYSIWAKHGRDPKIVGPIVPEFGIPENLSPMDMGTLISNGTLNGQYISAGIVNLAVAGKIKIEQIDKKNFKLTLIDKSEENLSDSEKTLIKKLFDLHDEVTTEDLKNKFFAKIPIIQEIITDQLKDQDLYQPPKWGAMVWLILLGAACFGLIFLVYPLGGVAVASLIASDIILTIFLILMPRRTLKGAQTMKKIEGFKLYMKTAERYRQAFNEKENIFEKFLPYAMIFGIVGLWTKAFAKIYEEIHHQDYFTTYQPVWFVAASNQAFNPDIFASSMENISSNMASTISSSPSSSGSGGGGFSGGGGGGGGGGGW